MSLMHWQLSLVCFDWFWPTWKIRNGVRASKRESELECFSRRQWPSLIVSRSKYHQKDIISFVFNQQSLMEVLGKKLNIDLIARGSMRFTNPSRSSVERRTFPMPLNTSSLGSRLWMSRIFDWQSILIDVDSFVKCLQWTVGTECLDRWPCSIPTGMLRRETNHIWAFVSLYSSNLHDTVSFSKAVIFAVHWCEHSIDEHLT